MLNVENSRIPTFKVLKSRNQFFLINMMYSNFFMRLILNPSDMVFETYELTEKEYLSLLKQNTVKNISTLNAVLITQPIVGVLYRGGKYLFQKIGYEDKAFFKITLYVFALAIPLIFGTIVGYISKEKSIQFTKNKSKYGLVIIDKKKISKINWGIQSILSLIIFIGLPSYFYFKINNGTEAILLIVVSIFYLIYILGSMSILQGPKYKQCNFKILNLNNEHD